MAPWEQHPDDEHAWRYVQPRLGTARLSRYVGRMRPGMMVDVTALRHGDMVAHVETDWGLSRQMFTHSLDFGYEFRTKGGEWIPEHDPRAMRWLERVRVELVAGNPPRHVGDYGHKLDQETVLMILRRNGKNPGGPPVQRVRS
jgi:hypothetical protein